MANEGIGLYTIQAKPVRMVFPTLFKPRKFKGPNGLDQGEPKYGARFIIDADHPDLQPIKILLAQVANADLPGRDLQKLTFPLVSGDKEIARVVAKSAAAGKKAPDNSFFAGKVVLGARSIEKYPPRLNAVIGGQMIAFTDETRATAERYFYSGVNVLIQLYFKSYEGFGGGVTAYLNSVVSLNTGDKIATGRSDEESFSEYLGKMTNYDPAGTGHMAPPQGIPI